MEKRSSFKELSKKICTANKMVYVESVRKLLKDYNTHDSPVSLTTFFNCKRFYSTLPSEKEKELCLYQLPNLQLLLQTINHYHTYKKLKHH